jgi:hypothetical protein
MKLPDYLRLAQGPPRLDLLVIGGYAVAAHGFARSTFDVDFLVPRADLPRWKPRLAAAGLQLVSERPAFAQFEAPAGGDPLDLMLVDDASFQKLWTDARAQEFDGVAAKVPSLDHVLALKLHVLRQALPHRTGKDAEDVEMLLRRHQVPLASEHYRELFLKYGNQELYDTFARLLRHP